MSLCEQAAVEKDPVRLLELVKRINDLLKPNRILDRKTYNDIYRHVFLLYLVIDDFAVRSS